VRDLVVIGGSLQGVGAVCKLLDQLPSPFEAPLLVVLHPNSGRDTDKRLSECTSRPVSYARDGERVESGRVYLAPTDRHLVVSANGDLGLDAGPKVGQFRPAADRLFETAARVYGARVIGVLLVGGGVDGIEGLRAIDAAGGIGVQQAPDVRTQQTAAAADPRTQAPYHLPLDDIAELLRSLVGVGTSVTGG